MKFGYVIFLLFFIPLYLYGMQAPTGSGTMEDPYLIENLENLEYITTYYPTNWSNTFYKQITDINAQESLNSNNGEGFKPIGNYTESFQGFYDGQGHTISNLYINRDDTHIALFGKTDGAKISNINVRNINFCGERFVGGIVGYAIDTTIDNCSSEGILVAFGGSWVSSGGIVGVCVGFTKIVSSFSKTQITGFNRIGGITSFATTDTKIENCYFIGDLSGNNYIGGIVGQMNSGNSPTVENCYAIADITYQIQSYCGMIIGKNETLNIVSCIFEDAGDLAGIGSGNSNQSFDSDNYQALTYSQMQDKTNFIDAGWDFSTTWYSDDETINSGYPYLYWQQESPYSLLIIEDETTQNVSAPEFNLEIEFDSPLPLGTQVMVNLLSSENTSMTGLTVSQQTLGNQFWRIKTTLSDNMTYDLTLNLTEVELPLSLDQVKILKREDEDSYWVDVIGLCASLSWQETEVTISGLNSFSDFIPVLDEGTLPVELSSFSGELLANNIVNLKWEVESESNLIGYYIFFNNSNNLSSAQLIPSLVHATNSPQYHSYNFTHNPQSNELTVFYWLKSIELSNQEEFYGPVQVMLNNETNSSPPISPYNKLFVPFPNPFNPTTTISYSVDKPQLVELDVYNMKGQLVRNLLSEYVSETNIKHSLVWNGKDNKNQNVSSEMYLIKLKLAKEIIIQKALLIK